VYLEYGSKDGRNGKLYSEKLILTVPGTCGPHIALVTGAGIGGSPELKQMLYPACKSAQPVQPHVSVFQLVMLATVILYVAASALHVSPETTR
jgi:hypothetical protein